MVAIRTSRLHDPCGSIHRHRVDQIVAATKVWRVNRDLSARDPLTWDAGGGLQKAGEGVKKAAETVGQEIVSTAETIGKAFGLF